MPYGCWAGYLNFLPPFYLSILLVSIPDITISPMPCGWIGWWTLNICVDLCSSDASDAIPERLHIGFPFEIAYPTYFVPGTFSMHKQPQIIRIEHARSLVVDTQVYAIPYLLGLETTNVLRPRFYSVRHLIWLTPMAPMLFAISPLAQSYSHSISCCSLIRLRFNLFHFLPICHGVFRSFHHKVLYQP